MKLQFKTHKQERTDTPHNREVKYLGEAPGTVKDKYTMMILYRTTKNVNNTARYVYEMLNPYTVAVYSNFGCILISEDKFEIMKTQIFLEHDLQVFEYFMCMDRIKMLDMLFSSYDGRPLNIEKRKLDEASIDPIFEYKYLGFEYEYLGNDPITVEGLWNFATVYNNKKSVSVYKYWESNREAKLVSVFSLPKMGYVCVLSLNKLKEGGKSGQYKKCSFEKLLSKIQKIYSIYQIGVISVADTINFCRKTIDRPEYRYLGKNPMTIMRSPFAYLFVLRSDPTIAIEECRLMCERTSIFSIFYIEHTQYICALSGYLISQHGGERDRDGACAFYENVCVRELVEIIRLRGSGNDIVPKDEMAKVTISSQVVQRLECKILNITQARKYIDMNPKEECQFVIISGNFLMGKRDHIEYLSLFDVLVDKILPVGGVIIVFFHDYFTFNVAMSEHDKYQIYSEVDNMYPGFFDDKYNEIEELSRLIYIKYEETLKQKAIEEADRNAKHSQQLVLRKQTDLIITKYDEYQLFITDLCQRYDIFCNETSVVVKLCSKKSAAQVATMIQMLVEWIAKSLLKYYVSEKRTIKYQPHLYELAALSYLRDKFSMYVTLDAYVVFYDKICSKIAWVREQAEIYKFSRWCPVNTAHISDYVGFPKEIDVAIQKNRYEYYGVSKDEFKHVHSYIIEKNKKDIYKYLRQTDNSCLKEIFVRSVLLILVSNAKESGLFHWLPMDVVRYIAHIMLKCISK